MSHVTCHIGPNPSVYPIKRKILLAFLNVTFSYESLKWSVHVIDFKAK